tara:strand:+ start:1915 stop:2532 length:618 start_codon:yes stop_codon:yes gene_type:complete
MPLDLKLNIKTTNDCKNLVISDLTGFFNAQSNPGGWQGLTTLSASLATNYIMLSIVPYFQTATEEIFFPTLLYPSTVGLLTNSNPRWQFPNETLEGFIFSVPSTEFYTDILTSLENFNSPHSVPNLSAFIPDLIYTVSAYIVPFNDPMPVYEQSFCFTNTCLTKKKVAKLFTTVNFECEDCDDKDLEKALLAKNLLETLEESCNI